MSIGKAFILTAYALVVSKLIIEAKKAVNNKKQADIKI